MQVILRSDIDKLGKRGDIVEVSDGHFRNFLLPQGLAIKATDGAVSQAGAMRRARDLRDASDREGAQTIASALVAKTITIPVKAGAEGRLYGSVTAADVAQRDRGADRVRRSTARSSTWSRSRPSASTRSLPSCTRPSSSRSRSRSPASKPVRPHGRSPHGYPQPLHACRHTGRVRVALSTVADRVVHSAAQSSPQRCRVLEPAGCCPCDPQARFRQVDDT